MGMKSNIVVESSIGFSALSGMGVNGIIGICNLYQSLCCDSISLCNIPGFMAFTVKKFVQSSLFASRGCWRISRIIFSVCDSGTYNFVAGNFICNFSMEKM